MPISFPTSPTLNQTYTYNNRTWIWSGTTWQSVGSALTVINSPVYESFYYSGPFAGTTYNFYITTNGTIQYLSSSTSNATVDIRSASGVTLDSIMSTNQSLTIVLLVTNASPAYYPTAWKIDGTTVYPKWAGGLAAPAAGSANAIDMYTLNILKTASNTYTILGSQVKYA